MYDLLVIGGGAAGLACAVAAGKAGDSVLILERMDRVGKKILATGNGRCNLMNTGKPAYPGGGEFAASVLRAFPVRRQKAFWQSLGLYLREEAGQRVYPVTGQASTVLDVLRFAYAGDTVTGAEVQSLVRLKNGFRAVGRNFSYEGRRVAVTGGGCAQAKLGSDGSCVRLLEHMGYPVSPLRPALTQIETETGPIRGLEGIRVRGRVTVFSGGRERHSEEGEILFTAYGLSGVCVMQCARYADGPEAEISLNLAEPLGLSGDALRSELDRRAAEGQGEHLLAGMAVARLEQAVIRMALGGAHAAKKPERADMERIAHCLTDFRLRVTGLRGFDSAQVTRGGVDPAWFDPGTMASRKDPLLHAAGEVLDVDGDCGGFNLMFAFAGGVLAGLNGRHAPWEE